MVTLIEGDASESADVLTSLTHTVFFAWRTTQQPSGATVTWQPAAHTSDRDREISVVTARAAAPAMTVSFSRRSVLESCTALRGRRQMWCVFEQEAASCVVKVEATHVASHGSWVRACKRRRSAAVTGSGVPVLAVVSGAQTTANTSS